MCKCVPADSKCQYFIRNIANVFGSPMDPYKDPNNVNISFKICVNVLQLIQNVNISFEIFADL